MAYGRAVTFEESIFVLTKSTLKTRILIAVSTLHPRGDTCICGSTQEIGMMRDVDARSLSME